jgi:chaperone modulatory protein CbpM
MGNAASQTVVLVNEDTQLELTEFARACGASTAFIEELIVEGLLVPRAQVPAPAFGGDAIARVRRVLRLQRDFDATLPSLGVMLDLLDEIERLRAQLRRAGIEPD